MLRHERLVHDTCVAGATNIMGEIGSVFMEQERTDAWQFFYEHLKAALEAYLVMNSRINQRLCKPTEN